MTGSDLALSIVLGVVLAAATGFRVFLPDAHCERSGLYRSSIAGQ